jgi:hypothetical protein
MYLACEFTFGGKKPTVEEIIEVLTLKTGLQFTLHKECFVSNPEFDTYDVMLFYQEDTDWYILELGLIKLVKKTYVGNFLYHIITNDFKGIPLDYDYQQMVDFNRLIDEKFLCPWEDIPEYRKKRIR